MTDGIDPEGIVPEELVPEEVVPDLDPPGPGDLGAALDAGGEGGEIAADEAGVDLGLEVDTLIRNVPLLGELDQEALAEQAIAECPRAAEPERLQDQPDRQRAGAAAPGAPTDCRAPPWRSIDPGRSN